MIATSLRPGRLVKLSGQKARQICQRRVNGGRTNLHFFCSDPAISFAIPDSRRENGRLSRQVSHQRFSLYPHLTLDPNKPQEKNSSPVDVSSWDKDLDRICGVQNTFSVTYFIVSSS